MSPPDLVEVTTHSDEKHKFRLTSVTDDSLGNRKQMFAFKDLKKVVGTARHGSGRPQRLNMVGVAVLGLLFYGVYSFGRGILEDFEASLEDLDENEESTSGSMRK